ncbi:MAG: hypothetical protein GWN29_05715, partial [Gammaproteobacteria bacterium]|nr:hypothetical protein [Gammaproteobacteria bacterium]
QNSQTAWVSTPKGRSRIPGISDPRFAEL